MTLGATAQSAVTIRDKTPRHFVAIREGGGV
jgi:hypothetical protein